MKVLINDFLFFFYQSCTLLSIQFVTTKIFVLVCICNDLYLFFFKIGVVTYIFKASFICLFTLRLPRSGRHSVRSTCATFAGHINKLVLFVHFVCVSNQNPPLYLSGSFSLSFWFVNLQSTRGHPPTPPPHPTLPCIDPVALSSLAAAIMTDRSVTEAGAFSRGISKLSEEKKIKEKTKSKRTTQIVFF